MSSEKSEAETWIDIAVYGRGKEQIVDSIEKHFGMPLSMQADHTWVGVKDAKKAMNVTSKGVSESMLAIVDVLCVIIMLAIVIIMALFIFVEVILYVIVLVVLTVFSGGAALKYTRVTYISANLVEISTKEIEDFTGEQIVAGRFVRVRTTDRDLELGKIASRATTATQLFRIGIIFSLAVATIFLFFEVIYRLLYGDWFTEIIVLAEFGLAFLAGIILMDIGVLLRRRLNQGIEASYVDGPLRESPQDY
jgi:hypothetical protein